jgi:hypothetical protein
MGGGSYDQDVAENTRTVSTEAAFQRSAYIAPTANAPPQRRVHPDLDPLGRMRECNNETPIVVAMDVTRSRGEDTKLVYERLPMFLGQIDLKGYVEGVGLSFAAIGDATAGDQAPLQVSQFEADNRLDEALSRVWIEEGGGGTGQESYELAAYFYARRVSMKCLEQGKKGFFFFLGDEGFYPQINPGYVSQILGDDVLNQAGNPTTFDELHERRPKANQEQLRQILAHKLTAPIDSKIIFDELQRRYHTFLIFPKKTMEERKSDIDAEIKQRVEAAGGLYAGVDIRASLLWNNRNDLDLHMVTPAGEHIYFGNKKATCGGWLDVDMNVRGETTKPVENIRWKKGTAPRGKYRVYVQNYAFHGGRSPTPFRVEIEINGKVRQFDGTVSQKLETGPASDVAIFEFSYDPSERAPEAATGSSPYDSYSDEVVLKQWGTVLPSANILRISDPKAVLDVMLGVIAIVGGKGDFDSYLADLQGRGQSAERKQEVAAALGELARTWQITRASVSGALPDAGDEARRGVRPRRLLGGQPLPHTHTDRGTRRSCLGVAPRLDETARAGTTSRRLPAQGPAAGDDSRRALIRAWTSPRDASVLTTRSPTSSFMLANDLRESASSSAPSENEKDAGAPASASRATGSRSARQGVSLYRPSALSSAQSTRGSSSEARTRTAPASLATPTSRSACPSTVRSPQRPSATFAAVNDSPSSRVGRPASGGSSGSKPVTSNASALTASGSESSSTLDPPSALSPPVCHSR